MITELPEPLKHLLLFDREKTYNERAKTTSKFKQVLQVDYVSLEDLEKIVGLFNMLIDEIDELKTRVKTLEQQ